MNDPFLLLRFSYTILVDYIDEVLMYMSKSTFFDWTLSSHNNNENHALDLFKLHILFLCLAEYTTIQCT